MCQKMCTGYKQWCMSYTGHEHSLILIFLRMQELILPDTQELELCMIMCIYIGS